MCKLSVEGAGYGAGGGIIGILLGYLGFKQRLDRMQDEIDGKVTNPTFIATIESIKDTHKSMDKKLDILIEYSTRRRRNETN